MKCWIILSSLFFVVACSESEESNSEESENQEKTEETSAEQEKDTETKYYANSEADLTIEGMSCEINCVNTVKKALGKVDGVTQVAIDFDAERKEDFCNVQFDSQVLNVQSLQAIIESVNDGAYKVTESESKKIEASEDTKESAFNFGSSSPNNRINTASSSFSLPSILDFVVALF